MKFVKQAFFYCKNLGPSGARNIGVSLARYDWIIFLDDDDYFMPEKLMILRETILNNDIDFIYHRARIFMINEKISYISSQKDIDKIPGEVYQHMLSGNFIGGPPNFAIKKSLFNKLHGFSDNVRAIEDYEFLLRLVRDVSKKRIIFVDNVLTGCNYITKSTSVSKNINNLKQACTYISEEYIRDNREFNLFKINTSLMTAHALLMSLNRKSAFFYFKAGIVMFNIKYIVSGIISFISPVLMIKLRGKV